MRSWTKRAIAAGLALVLGAAPSLGAEFDPRGRWQHAGFTLLDLAWR